MKNNKMYSGYRYSALIISHTAWLYFCFTLSFRDIEELMPTALIDVAHELEAGFQCGTVFSSKGQLDNYLRLSFAHYNEGDIRLGIRRLKALF